MDWPSMHDILLFVQRGISFLGMLVILSGILVALYQYIYHFFSAHKRNHDVRHHDITINTIRLNLGRTLILGLEFIVAADLIGTTTTPDYYSVGIVASIVLIRTLLSFSLNRELMTLGKEK